MPALERVLRSWLIVYRKKQSTLATNDKQSLRSSDLERQTTNQPGFTLIELMVAISIVAILSTIGMTVYSKAQALARDSKRKEDLKSITIALELYYQKHQKYPWSRSDIPASAPDSEKYSDTNNRWYYTCSTNSTGGNWFPQLASGGFTERLRDDPINTGYPWNDDGYGYCYGNAIGNGQTYSLSAQLENKDDPDRCGVKRWKRLNGENWCQGEPPKYGSFHSNFLFEAGPNR